MIWFVILYHLAGWTLIFFNNLSSVLAVGMFIYSSSFGNEVNTKVFSEMQAVWCFWHILLKYFKSLIIRGESRGRRQNPEHHVCPHLTAQWLWERRTRSHSRQGRDRCAGSRVRNGVFPGLFYCVMRTDHGVCPVQFYNTKLARSKILVPSSGPQMSPASTPAALP